MFFMFDYFKINLSFELFFSSHFFLLTFNRYAIFFFESVSLTRDCIDLTFKPNKTIINDKVQRKALT